MGLRLEWSHTVMYVRDLDVMLDFYTNVLGFEVADRGHLGGPETPEIVFISQSATDHHQLAFLPIRSGEAPSNSTNHMAFRTGSLAEVRDLAGVLERDERVTGINPMTHGNAWSVYFDDPEGNGVEVFCDTPWHVRQPQGRPLDLTKSDDELHAWTRKEFENEPEFGPIEAFYAARAEALRER